MSGLTLALFIQYSLNFLKPRMPYLRGIEVCLVLFSECYLWQLDLLLVLLSHSNHDRTSGHDSLRYTFPFLLRCFVALRSASTHAKY